MASASPIQPLPDDVVAHLKSSVAITSLNTVVLELVKNSLDASSQKIDISVEYARGSCSVEDDGFGILPSEFREDGGLAKLHHSSKYSSGNVTYGGHGIFLASLSAMSLLTIISHHHLYHSYNAITINQSRVLSRQTPAPQQNLSSSSHGTRVIVRDLFGNMPVRVKQRALDHSRLSTSRKEWEELRSGITGLVLAWPHRVHIVIRDAASGEKLVFRDPSNCRLVAGSLNVEHVCNTLWQARLTSSPQRSSWVTVDASTNDISIRGSLSLDPAPTKDAQFISLGIHPLDNNTGRHVLYEEIDYLFANSSFGNEELADANEVIEDKSRNGNFKCTRNKYSRKELKGSKKGLDRWPMFSIEVDSKEMSRRGALGDSENLVTSHTDRLSPIVNLLQATILEFLRSHHFSPKVRQGRRIAVEEQQERVDNLPAKKKHPIQGVKSHGHDDNHCTPVSLPIGPREAATSPDLIGTRIRLPSFKHGSSSRPASPFDEWSKIKYGNRRSLSNQHELGKKSHVVTEQNAESSPKVATVCSGSPSIIAKSGRIIRKPFDEPLVQNLDKGGADTFHSVPDLGTHGECAAENLEGTLIWVNPVTKERSRLNRRTGLALRPVKAPTLLDPSISSVDKHFQGRRLTCTTESENHPDPGHKPSEWVADVLKAWDNPVFAPTEAPIPQVPVEGTNSEARHLLRGFRHNCSQVSIDNAFKDSSAGFLGRLSRSALLQAEVISQVDHKFILIKMMSDKAHTECEGQEKGSILVIVDQHAADERCRIEQLMAELCSKPSTGRRDGAARAMKPGILSTPLEKHILFDLSYREAQILRRSLQHFADWGILMDLEPLLIKKSTPELQVRVQSLPPGIVERCKSSPKLLIDLIREEIWKTDDKQGRNASTIPTGEFGASEDEHSKNIGRHGWVEKIHNCPQGILDLLNSRSCRSAIMFNDELSKDECQTLISRLANCAFPFQCAHGRPSMIPLVDLGTIKQGVPPYPEQGSDFGSAFRRWREDQSDCGE